MLREIKSILNSRNLDFLEMPTCARILLVTDGTVTELLEALMSEKIILGFKNQHIAEAHPGSPIAKNEQHLNREITLQGEDSGIHFLYAESRLCLEALGAQGREMLLDQNVPIGTVLKRLALDTHRKIIDCGMATHANGASLLGLPPDHQFLFRSYEIIAGAKTLMWISEWFPIQRIVSRMSKIQET